MLMNNPRLYGKTIQKHHGFLILMMILILFLYVLGVIIQILLNGKICFDKLNDNDNNNNSIYEDIPNQAQFNNIDIGTNMLI